MLNEQTTEVEYFFLLIIRQWRGTHTLSSEECREQGQEMHGKELDRRMYNEWNIYIYEEDR